MHSLPALPHAVFAPFILTAFFGSLSIMEGKTIDEGRKVIEELLWPSLKMNWMFWPGMALDIDSFCLR